MGDCIYYYKDLHIPDCIVVVDNNQRGQTTRQEQYINAYTNSEEIKKVQNNPALTDPNLRRSSSGRRIETRNMNKRKSPDSGASKKRKKKDSVFLIFLFDWVESIGNEYYEYRSIKSLCYAQSSSNTTELFISCCNPTNKEFITFIFIIFVNH